MFKRIAYFSENILFLLSLSLPLNGIKLQFATDTGRRTPFLVNAQCAHPSAIVVCRYCRNNEKQPKTILHMNSCAKIAFAVLQQGERNGFVCERLCM